jgi:hypothetical protein
VSELDDIDTGRAEERDRGFNVVNESIFYNFSSHSTLVTSPCHSMLSARSQTSRL